MDILIPRIDHDIRLPLGSIDTLNGVTMGTYWHVRWVGMPGLSISFVEKKIKVVLAKIIQEMSHWEVDSALSCFNHAPKGWYQMPEGLLSVLRCGLSIAEETDHAYHPGLGELINLWGFGANKRYDHSAFSMPDNNDIEALIQRSSWKLLRVDQQYVYQPGGVELDLSGIAKGFAVDQLGRLFSDLGIESFLIDIGGELTSMGVKPNGQPWWVDLECPLLFGHEETIKQRLALYQMSVATSGNYRQYFTRQGHHYSHTLDGRSGLPIENNVISCTVLHSSCMCADAYATALTVLGSEKGIEFANQYQIAVQLITHDHVNQKIGYHPSSAWLMMLA